MRIIVSLLVAALLGWLVPFQPVAAATVAPGDLIKSPEYSTIYYYGYDGKRYVFPNSNIYFSWYKDFSRVKSISTAELGAIPIGGNILVRPGTYLVKITTDPKVYAVEPEGVLRHIESTAQASDLYGATWTDRVIDLPDSFFTNYNATDALPGNQHPTGTVFRYQGEPNDYYLLTNGHSREFVSRVSWDNYHWNDQFIVDVPYHQFRYEEGEGIDQYRVSLADTAQTLIADERSDLGEYRYTPSQSREVHGLRGEYYLGPDFNKRKFSRVDDEINFDWGFNSPAPGRIDEDNFSVRWSGEIEPEYSGTYTFYTYSDDGVRLYVDGDLVISNWTDHKATWDEGDIYLTEGRHDIVLEYYDSGQHAIIELHWQSKGNVIDQRYFWVER